MKGDAVLLRAKVFSILAFFALACQSPRSTSAGLAAHDQEPYLLSASVYDTASQENPNSVEREYVSLAVPFTEIHDLKARVAESTGLVLKDRGEAHITALTPPEMATVRKKLSASAVFNAIEADSIQSERFDVVCVGEGKKANRRVFFVVVKAPGLIERREKLATAFEAAGGAHGAFKADAFYPHITVGFTHSDLFEQDGVIKDEHSCIAPLVVQ